MAAPLAIHLLGPDPRVLHGGATSPAPRGRKTWALLAYLVAADAAPSRELLAELLFADAEDPMNALSWNLSQLRRLLGPEVEVGGTAIVLRLPDDAYVDVRSLSTATWRQGLAIPDLGRDLLEGMTFPGCPIFETWLLATRRRLHGSADAVLMEAAQALLSEGSPARALPLASRLVSANPLDENAHELLIRAYAAAGDLDAAQTQLHRSVALLRKELGIEPASSLLEAATAPAPRFAVAAVRATPQTIRARLEAGTAAQDAGAADTAIDLFRQAVAEAHGLEDDRLLVRALVALGSALVHGVRGRDGEGAAYLHEASAWRTTWTIPKPPPRRTGSWDTWSCSADATNGRSAGWRPQSPWLTRTRSSKRGRSPCRASPRPTRGGMTTQRRSSTSLCASRSGTVSSR
jgi:DNA-binding SARP family transcriptional activator